MLDSETLDRCRQLLTTCVAELGWPLDDAARERYLTALAPLLAETPADDWPAVAANYHADHALVASLRDSGHPEHGLAWARWSAQVLGILRRSGRDWSRDGALDAEDLAQVARVELVRALPGYRYRSRFSSWAYSVVVRCAQRQLRAAQAQRRSAPTISLDAQENQEPPADPHARHEQAANARLLAERVATVLGAHPDRRLALIFQLWAAEEQTSAEIGAVVGLHESRVRALLKVARALLREDPVIRAWAGREADGPIEAEQDGHKR